MPAVDVLINIHATYFSCLDMLVTSVGRWLTLELLPNGSPTGVLRATESHTSAQIPSHPHYIVPKKGAAGMVLGTGPPVRSKPDTSES